MKLDPRLLQALCCPQCRGPLEPTDAHLRCPACKLRWPVFKGIPHLNPESAKKAP
ncbi:MAG: Trm112 family protein [Myxococcota bacterium]|nr:Trm112 family protein [Myxococcota bacterium]